MIRKAIAFFIITYIALWLGIAHYTKGQIISIIDHSWPENNEISFSNIAIKGFPFSLIFIIDNFNIKTARGRHTIEFIIPKITIDSNFSLKNMDIIISKDIHFAKMHHGIIQAYVISAAEDIKSNISLNKPLMFSDSYFSNILKRFKLTNEALIVSADGQIICSINDIVINLNFLKNENDKHNIDVKFQLKYSGDSQDQSFDVASFDVNAIIKLEHNISKLLEFRHATLTLDQDSSVTLQGEITVPQNYLQLPSGKILVSFTNYENFIDKMLPENYNDSTIDVKALLRSAANSAQAELDSNSNIQLDVILSDNDIKIGNLTLKNFYQEVE